MAIKVASQDEKKGLELGAAGYLAKPFDPSVLLASIEKKI